jgi:hypothetical protein
LNRPICGKKVNEVNPVTPLPRVSVEHEHDDEHENDEDPLGTGQKLSPSSIVLVLRRRARSRLFFGCLVQAKFQPIAFSIQPSSILAIPIEDDDDDEEDEGRRGGLGQDAKQMPLRKRLGRKIGCK